MPNFRWRHSRSVKLMAATLAVALLSTGCGGTGTGDPGAAGDPGDAAADGPPKVLTTFTVIADMAQRVAGDRLVVESITKPGSEIHEYEPTPDDLIRAQDADLVLDNGLGLERWFSRFVDRTGARSATLSDGVVPIPIAIGSYQGQPNPHAWMSPQAGEIYVRNIATALSGADPPNAGV